MIVTAVLVIAGTCLLASLLPLVPVAHGAVRSFDFARLQIMSICGAVILVCLAFGWPASPAVGLAIAMALAALIIQTFFVLPFTPLWKKQTVRFAGDPDIAGTLSVLACNVKQGNRDFSSVAALIASEKPDLAVFMETDEKWAAALRPHLSEFHDLVECPQDNSYGMILASRLPLRECEVKFLLNEEVPSIHAVVRMPDGRDVRVIALHPEPPLPVRDTLGRDAEILLVGEMARKEEGPMIVTGDLNDVAWSRTTRRFLRLSRLLDPRQGRGLFNSFDARRWYLRWPLDHIFHSHHFELVGMKRLPFVGSDHFPMFYRFALAGTGRNETPPAATDADMEEADDVVAKEQDRDRPPVGTDWE